MHTEIAINRLVQVQKLQNMQTAKLIVHTIMTVCENYEFSLLLYIVKHDKCKGINLQMIILYIQMQLLQ